jgi:hypothetical protein
VVIEYWPLMGRRQVLARVVIERERFADLSGVELGLAVNIDPEQLRPTQAPRPLRQVVKVIHRVAVEEDRVAYHPFVTQRPC